MISHIDSKGLKTTLPIILVVVVAAILPSCKKKRSAPSPSVKPAVAAPQAQLQPVKQVVEVVAPEPKRPNRQQVMACIRKFGHKLKISEDPGVGLTWVEPAGGIWERMMGEVGSPMCLFFPYLGINSDGKYWTRLRTNYVGKRWLFVDHIIIMIDGEKETILLDRQDVDRNSGSTVSEVIDQKGHAELIHRIAEGKEVYISLSGQHRRETWNLGKEQVEAFQTISGCLKAIDGWSETEGGVAESASNGSIAKHSGGSH